MPEFLTDPETWVAVAFAIFIGIMIAIGVPKILLDRLDGRRTRIRAELDEALRLRHEAEEVLAQYRRKQKEAEQEAKAIIVNARGEAERLVAEARTKVEDFIARRTRIAEAKIAQAEAHALADVRAAAADAAVTAAEKVLAETTRGAAAESLIEQGIRDVKSKLN
jgi:F-type H+-transporting ATPase subunit b